MFGPIKKIIMINDVDTGKPKGYAFIEYEHERDMHGKRWRKLHLIQASIDPSEQRNWVAEVSGWVVGS
jgi:hypothetical protein